ncbi:MAG: hypothetical protein JNK65_08075, partial [Deltaproteobacteria bacterium]|nr:hypothetical protein [Deltaproteobacteria bacterium]
MKNQNVVSLFLKKQEELKSLPCLRYKSKGVWKTISWDELKDRIARFASHLSDL